MNPRHVSLRRALLGVWGAIIGVVTLTPMGGPTRTLSTCLVCGEFGTSEFLLNALLFVPLGWLLGARPTFDRSTLSDRAGIDARTVADRAGGDADASVVARPALLRAVAAGASLSLAIELLQWLAIAGRVASPGDWMANTMGAGLGTLLMRRRRTASTAGSLPLALRRMAALMGVAMALAYGQWSSTPWLPRGRWYLQRTPVRSWSDAHSGALTFVGIHAVNLPSDRIHDTALIEGVRHGSSPVVVEEIVGPPVPRPAYAVRVVEANGAYELLALTRDGNDALLARLTNSARSRTGRVALRTPDVYANHINTSVRWSLWPATGRILTEPSLPNVQFTSPSPLRGWTLLVPRVAWLEGWQLWVLDAGWALVLAGLLVGGMGVRKPQG